MSDTQVKATVAECRANAERDSYPENIPALEPIPAARYTDTRLYALEMEHIWKKTWLMAGHVSELPEAGSYKLFEQLGESIIVSRGTDGEIRAFHNICRHRSAPLLKEPAGKTKRFLCPYHSWSFSLDGELTHIPEERNFACLDRAENALLRVRCEQWRDFIFVSLDNDASSLAEYLAPVTARLEGFPFEEMELKRFKRVEIDANWKTVFDNFIESYHLNTVHPAISRWVDSSTFVAKPMRNGHSYFTLMRKNGNKIIEDEALSPPGEFPLFDNVVVTTPIFPNVAGGLDTGGFVWESFWPSGPLKTVVDIPLYGWKGATDEAHWDKVMAENLRLLGEDLAILPGVQQAMLTGHVRDVKLGAQELGIAWYHEEIDRRIGIPDVPEELRVPQLLKNFTVA